MSEQSLPRYTTEAGTRLLVQVPEADSQAVLDAILSTTSLAWGDYDQVAYTSAPGIQQFRSCPGGVNRASDTAVEVACVELQVFVAASGAEMEPVLRAIYDSHPYEEPVIQMIPAVRSLHIRGMDDDNPNRFWNRPPADWVPDIHRSAPGPDGETA